MVHAKIRTEENFTLTLLPCKVHRGITGGDAAPRRTRSRQFDLNGGGGYEGATARASLPRNEGSSIRIERTRISGRNSPHVYTTGIHTNGATTSGPLLAVDSHYEEGCVGSVDGGGRSHERPFRPQAPYVAGQKRSNLESH